MTLKQTLYFVLALCFLIIGVHQTWLYGWLASYWLFMVMLVFLFLFRMEVAAKGIPKVQQHLAEKKAAQSAQTTAKTTTNKKPKR